MKNERALKYLATLAEHPELSREKLEKLCGFGKGFAERWARNHQEFREEEKAIRTRWKITDRRRRMAERAAAASMPSAPEPISEEDRLSPALERFLEVFAEEGAHRTKTIARCKKEGFPLEWEDIDEAMRDRRFSRRFSQVFERALVEVEDEQIAKAKKGTVQSALAVLRAHKPALYGNNLKVTVSGGIQLTAADRASVEDAKANGIRRFRERAAVSAAALARTFEPVVEDIVTAEVVGEEESS